MYMYKYIGDTVTVPTHLCQDIVHSITGILVSLTQHPHEAKNTTLERREKLTVEMYTLYKSKIKYTTPTDREVGEYNSMNSNPVNKRSFLIPSPAISLGWGLGRGLLPVGRGH